MYSASGLSTAFFMLTLAPMQAQSVTDPVARENSTLRSDTLVPPSTQADAKDQACDSTHMAFASKDEGAWIGITGSVSKVGDRSFVLKHADGSVGIALGSQKLRDHFFQEGRTVTAYGRVDESFFTLKVLKARAVLVGADQDAKQVVGERGAVPMLTTLQAMGTVVHGRVTGIEGRKVSLEQEDGLIIVDTSTLSYDPMQAQAHMRVERGDMITAQGKIGDDLWTGRSLKATTLDVVKMGQAEQEGGEDGTNAPVRDPGVEGSLHKK